MILAIETSCDDTCAAVVTDDGRDLLANVVSSQGVHRASAASCPEIASRHHLELVNAVVDDALDRAGATLDDVEQIAVTQGPGLVGALLVGVATAKALAAARRLPLVPVDHLHGHVAANYLQPDPIEPPFTCLIASGGHTLLANVTDHRGYELLGQTLDDAAGEAFDKGARLLGLGYPGGPALSKLAAAGRPGGVRLPDRRPRHRPRLLVRGAQDRAAVQGARPGGGGDRPPRRRSRRELRARDRRGADRARRARAGDATTNRGWRSAAASPPTGCCASAPPRSACRSTSRRPSCAPTTRR